MEEEIRYETILRELLETRQYTKLRQTASDMNVADIAAVMDDMEDEESLKMFRILPKDMAADVFANLELESSGTSTLVCTFAVAVLPVAD